MSSTNGSSSTSINLRWRASARLPARRISLHADRHCHIWPRPVRFALEATQVGGRDRERAVVEECADRLDRRAGIATELRSRVAEDVKPGRREAGRRQELPETAVERATADPVGSGPRLPKRLTRVHRRELLASIRERSQDRLPRRARQFSPAALAALAPV